MADKEMQDNILTLRRKYKYIVKWGKELQSYDYFIDSEVLKAESDNAPLTAIYKSERGWRTVEDLSNIALKKRLMEG